jgi:general secretion pathway protein J
MTQRDGNAGFALVQAIAALGLSALSMVVMISMGSLAVRNSDVSAARLDDVEHFATGLSALRRDLAATKRLEAGQDRDGPILFFGGARAMGLAIGGGPGAQDEMVMIVARTASEGGGLVRMSRPLNPGEQGFEGGRWSAPVVLVGGPWLFEFSYAAGDAAASAPHASWPFADRLPASVHIQVAGPRLGKTAIPRLVVPLRVDTASPCLEDEGDRCKQDPAEAVGGG